MVIRYIKGDIPTIEELNLPQSLKELIMMPRGLILVVGSTGSGKSTSLASMIDHRNASATGHFSLLKTRSSSCIHTKNRWWTSARWAWIPSPTR